jgi:hypothetical protein
MDHGFEALVSFVIARGDAAEFLDLAEAIFDQMPPLVHLEVARNAAGPVDLGRDHGQRAPLVQIGTDNVAIEGPVRQQGGKVEILEKRGNTNAVVSLSWQQDEAREIAQRIDQGDDLGRQAATGTPDGLSLSSPFAPVPC